MHGKQDPRVAPKYEMLYGVLHTYARSLLASLPSGDPAATFVQLRDKLQAAWDVILDAGGEISREEFERRCAAFLATPRSWMEQGRRVDGTQLDQIRAWTRLHTNAVRAHSPADCDMILDLGCGWGHRLWDVYTHGGPRNAAYWGLERAAPGLATARLVATLFPAVETGFAPFDFMNPDFTAVAGAPKSIVVYSFLAIEQVFRLGSGLFDALRARFPDATITGIHLEPIGFQAFSGDPAWDTDLRYAMEHRYNIDLYDQVRLHPALSISAFETRVFDEGLGNSTSLLVWRSRQ